MQMQRSQIREEFESGIVGKKHTIIPCQGSGAITAPTQGPQDFRGQGPVTHVGKSAVGEKAYGLRSILAIIPSR